MGARRRAGESEGARRATGDSPAAATRPDSGRFSSQRKLDAVLRLLRGEDLDTVSRQLGVTAARLSEWRDEFIAAGKAGLKSRPAQEVSSEEAQRMKTVIADLTMRNELLRERARALEAGRPLPQRRPRS